MSNARWPAALSPDPKLLQWWRYSDQPYPQKEQQRIAWEEEKGRHPKDTDVDRTFIRGSADGCSVSNDPACATVFPYEHDKLKQPPPRIHGSDGLPYPGNKEKFPVDPRLGWATDAHGNQADVSISTRTVPELDQNHPLPSDSKYEGTIALRDGMLRH
ncbi:hypothetical protein EC973_004406 [Apophysomyces ossiformis]|uniref:Uncharacterized protein n=1 Tax=Apophysomyces ossiformis TaxID=679940 RepID=A0A8H7ERX0_9FUNG|nr:hypothetical protein EC973_004406 [Apophysomyces ossiformis]